MTSSLLRLHSGRNRRVPRVLRRALPPLAAALALACAGCSILPEPQSDPTRNYILSTSAGPAAEVAANAPVIQLRPIEVAPYLRGRPMVVRRGENEVEFREFALWGESLEDGVARVLREELLARGAARAVVASGARTAMADGVSELRIRLLACEGGADGAVYFRAAWELRPAGGNAAPLRGDYRPGDLRWDGKTDAQLAARLSEAVAGLAGAIAAAR